MAQIRDIRPDLKARLELVTRRREDAKQRYETEINAIKTEEGSLLALLEAEERRVAAGYTAIARHPGAANELENAILDILSNERDWPHGNIKAELIERGMGKDDATFGRSIHGVLLSMKGRELVDSAGIGVWRISKKARQMAEAAE